MKLKIAAAFAGLALLSGCSNAQSQSSGPTSADVAGQLRKEYNNCVLSSVAKQLRDNFSQDPSLVSEVAFQSCSTEEQGMASLLYSTGARQSDVNTTLVAIRLELKRTVREFVQNPEKYRKMFEKPQ
jgi:hypothetical protein